MAAAVAGGQDSQSAISSTRLSDSVLVVDGPNFERHCVAVSTGEGVVVIESLFSTDAADEARRLIESTFSEPVRAVINTHCHPDHSFGNTAFADVPIIAQSGYQARMQMVIEGWSGILTQQIDSLTAQLAETAEGSQDAASLHDALEQSRQTLDFLHNSYVLPSVYVDAGMTLTFGGKEIQVLFFGPGHTDHDLVVWVPSEKLLVMGDLLFGAGYFPYTDESLGGSTANWVATLDRLLQTCAEAEHVVPGHGKVGGLELIRAERQVFQDLLDAAAEARSRGLTLEQALEEVWLEQYRSYAWYDFRHDENLTAAWHALEELEGQTR